MQGLKYLTIDELEKFVVNLRAEINSLQGDIGENINLFGGIGVPMDIDTFQHKKLKESTELLRQAEDEILERTLLGSD